ncbi:hypothetical protein BN12_4060017 [Nostocoides japonicum T1-X7]|uniref:Uncharacterized protein n=1 Tax=Nostocoides japonicum T1-X7 TaxID=1194083 RepID=A0A077M2H6_9MICO|nr:hypothetical protein BN12_4060017 [Tetrasphaera japonica T1-X7]
MHSCDEDPGSELSTDACVAGALVDELGPVGVVIDGSGVARDDLFAVGLSLVAEPDLPSVAETDADVDVATLDVPPELHAPRRQAMLTAKKAVLRSETSVFIILFPSPPFGLWIAACERRRSHVLKLYAVVHRRGAN